MFTFEEHCKKYEKLIERTNQAYDFWVNCVFSSVKEFFKVK